MRIYISQLIFSIFLVFVSCQKAINLIETEEQMTCNASFEGKQFNYKQLGGIQYIKNESKFSISGILRLSTYQDATDDSKDISILYITYNPGKQYLDSNLKYLTLQSKVLSMRLTNKKIVIYASQSSTTFPSSTITTVIEQDIYLNPLISTLAGKDIYFYLSVNIASGSIYFCHQILGEQDTKGCHTDNLTIVNSLIPNFNNLMSEKMYLHFGYDKDFANYCYGIADLKFISGFYSSDQMVINYLHGGERAKKAYWKFDEINSSNIIQDQWRSRQSQMITDASLINQQQLMITRKQYVVFMDSQMNEMKSHTISFWINVQNPGSVSFANRILMQRMKQTIPIFTIFVMEVGDSINYLLLIQLYDSLDQAVLVPNTNQLKFGQDYHVTISIFQLLSMQKVSVRTITYSSISSPNFTDNIFQVDAVYPRGGLESDLVNNSFVIGSLDNQDLDIQIYLNEMSIQSGHSIFKSSMVSQFYIDLNCQLSIGVINPACILCKNTYYLNHLDGNCYQNNCYEDSQFQAENPSQRVCELCDSSCSSKQCTGSSSSECLVCPEGFSLDSSTNKCKTVCGDGLVRGDEECDGGASTVLGCSPTLCKVEPLYECINYEDKPSFCSKCGDFAYNIHLINEECEYSITGLIGCTSDCKIEKGYECNNQGCYEICGDGVVGPNEQCDDGNSSGNDGCDQLCDLETNYVCFYENSSDLFQTCKKSTTCGDGILGLTLEGSHNAEFCDDANTVNGDGCSSNCTIEPDFACTQSDSGKSICTAICGDSKRYPNFEECDVGNVNGVGCQNCKIVQGYSCSGGSITTPDICTEICGDGIVVGSEVCDDGIGSKICLNNCKSVDPKWVCTINTDLKKSICLPKCGDGKKLTEECDDGNLVNGDGCSSDCKLEYGYTCVGGNENQPDICSAKCDAKTKECDDGNMVEGDGCSNSCKVEKGFVCMKQGNSNGVQLPDACFSVCGDGILTAQEICDDGNNINGDGCSIECKLENGFKCSKLLIDWLNDQIYTSKCESLCGDSIHLASEECDDGNNIDLDGCSYDCLIESGYGCLVTNNQDASICNPCSQVSCSKCIFFYDSNDLMIDSCTDCQQGYYLDSNKICQKCSENCLSCTSPTSCLQCELSYLLTAQSSCQLCSQENGYNYDSDTGKCMEICGDGKRVGTEECDDGNLLSGDGCSIICSVEYGFKCSQQINMEVNNLTNPDVCWRLEGTLAYMIQDEEQPNLFKIFFEDEVIITYSDKWQLDLPFMNKDSYEYVAEVVDQSIHITIKFSDDNPSIKGEFAIFYFVDAFSVRTKIGNQELSQKKINTLIKYDYSNGWFKLSDGSVEMIIMQVFIYIATFTFIASFIASVIISSSIPFWSTIEFLQQINLLQYQNVQIPSKLKYFLSLFNFVNFRLIGDMQIKQGDEMYHAVEAPSSFQKTGLNNLFIFNFIPILIIWVLVFSLYAASKLFLRLKNNSPIQQVAQNQSCLYKFMLNYSQTFKYNIIVRTLIFIFMPLSLITLLQVQGSNFSYPLTAISSVLSYFALIVVVAFPILAFYAIRQRHNQIDAQMFQKKFGSLLFGLNLKNNVSKIFNVQNTVKKFILSLLLVSMYDSPISQSALISIVGCIHLGIVLYFSPKSDNRESNRITFGEMSLLFINCSFIAYAFDDQTFRLNGTLKNMIDWFTIILIMIAYLLEVIYLARQAIIHIKNRQYDKNLKYNREQLQTQNMTQLQTLNRVHEMRSNSINNKQLSKLDNL